MATLSASLLTLPVEIIYDIHLYALSEHLATTCRWICSALKNAPRSLCVEYLLARCADRRPQARVLSRALRFPVCDIPVLDILLRDHFTSSDDRSVELPRRFFKDLAPREPSEPPWQINDQPLPFLRYLVQHTRLNVNAFDGYALTRAVFAGNAPLVRFLLDQGADPECKGGLAVLIAIRRKDMHTARTLIERDYVPPIASKKRKLKHAAFDVDDDPRSDVTASGGAKKRKLGDRVSVSKEMLRAAQESGAEDIVTYFISEKGCIPDIRTLTMMGSGSPRPAVSASTARRLAAHKSKQRR